jgi:monofunctional glycosyltransferase
MTRARFKTIYFKILSVLIGLFFLTLLYMYFSRDVSKLVREFPHSSIQKDSISFEIKPGRPKNWVNLKEISGYAKWAIILSEDWGFYQHEGIDVEQIKVALNDMVEERKFRGASTITQQMVKNVYLSEDRTIWRKLHEMILAFKLEKAISKSRILEIYLNVIEFGPGVYGIKQASWHYFRKLPSGLDPRESAFLSMLLPSPKRYYISYRKKKLTKFARERVNAILLKMRMGKVISPAEYEVLKESRLSWER